MEKSKSIKVIIAIIYLIFLSAFLYFLFSKFSIQEIISYISYDFIKYNSKYLTGLRESNLFLISITFILIGIFWISVLQGFGSILILASGFIFGTIIGTIISVITLTLGSTLTYIFANYFFKDLIKEKFTNRFKFLEEKIKSNEFFIIFAVRVCGGTPLQLQNLLPVLFNIRIKNFFFASLFGFVPSVYVFSALGAGIENQIDKNLEPPSFSQMITSFEIYAPILAFFFLLILAFFLRKVFYKN
tara:strand:+ start:615 stop:1346 length:732 start_codon:yes stop_codon:yes gene_type:complete